MLRSCVNFCAARSALGAVACALAVALLPRVAAAQQGPVTLRLSSTPAWDSNVFRVPDGVNDPQLARGLSGKSDRSTATTIGLSFNKAYAQQSVLLEIDNTATRHQKFKFLDRDAINYRAVWRWHLTPRISGTLSTDRAQSVVGFDDTQDQTLTTTTTRNRNFALDAWLFGGWHLLAGAGESERGTSRVFLSDPASDQASADFGIRYDYASGSSISATRRLTRGVSEGQEVDPVNLIDNVFALNQTDLRATWIVSGKSTLAAHLGRIERRHRNIPQRDFSGINADSTYTWTPAGRLTVVATASRAISPFLTGTSSTYRVEDTLAFAPTWRVSEKVGLSIRASRRASEFRGPVVPVAGPPRRDVLTSMQFGASWTPTTNVRFAATLQRDRRTSTDIAFFYNGTTASLSASLTF